VCGQRASCFADNDCLRVNQRVVSPCFSAHWGSRSPASCRCPSNNHTHQHPLPGQTVADRGT